MVPVIAEIIGAHCAGTSARTEFVQACLRTEWSEVQAIVQCMLAEPWHLIAHMAHPDATIAMISGSKDVSANFSSVPFQNRQARTPGIRRLMTSTDILGAPFSFNIVATTSKFRAENPKLYKAYLDALNEATAIVNNDKKLAAETYLRMAKDKTPIEEILALLNEPEHIFYDQGHADRRHDPVHGAHGQFQEQVNERIGALVACPRVSPPTLKSECASRQRTPARASSATAPDCWDRRRTPPETVQER